MATWVVPDRKIDDAGIENAQMDVDYVRVYQKSGWTGNGTVSGTWGDTSNWGPDGKPEEGDTAVFNRPTGTTTVTLPSHTKVRALYFDDNALETDETPAFTIKSAEGENFTLQLGATESEYNGVGGITINNSVTQSQTIEADIEIQQPPVSSNWNVAQPLILSNLTDASSGVELNANGGITSLWAGQTLTTMGTGRINIPKVDANGEVGEGHGVISSQFTDLYKDGPGELRLAGANEYTGATYVKDGTLLIGADVYENTPGPLGNSDLALVSSVEGYRHKPTWENDEVEITEIDIMDGRDIAILIDGPFTFGRKIRVENKNYRGTTTLGANTEFDAEFSRVIVLAREVSLTAEEGSTVTFSDAIHNYSHQFPGSITKIGEGTVILSGGNTYSGPTVIESGTVRLGRGSALGDSAEGTTVLGGAALDLNGQSPYYDDGPEGLPDGPEALTIQGSEIDGTAALINSSEQLAVVEGPLTVIGDGRIGGSGEIEFHDVSLADGATLTMEQGKSLDIGGTLDVGGSVGAATVFGDLVFGPAAGLEIELEGSSHDQVAVAADVSLAGQLELKLTGAAPFETGSYALMTYDSHTGTFNPVTDLNAYVTGDGLDYGGHELTLTIDHDLLIGDLDLDGDVDFFDYIATSNNFGQTGGMGFQDGDMDGDGDVDFFDYIAVSNHFGDTLPAVTGVAGATNVPEPSALVLLTAGALGFLACVWRRRRC